MNTQRWPRRHGNATNPLPAYLQPLRSAGRVRFDPTLQTAGEILASRQILVRPEPAEFARSLDRGALSADRLGGHRSAA